jgi:hypothetical protein
VYEGDAADKKLEELMAEHDVKKMLRLIKR